MALLFGSGSDCKKHSFFTVFGTSRSFGRIHQVGDSLRFLANLDHQDCHPTASLIVSLLVDGWFCVRWVWQSNLWGQQRNLSSCFPSKSYELFVSEFQQILLLQVATFCYFLGRLSPAQRAMALDAKDYEIQRVYWWTFGWKFTGGRFSLPCVGSAREPWSENTGHTGHTSKCDLLDVPVPCCKKKSFPV